MQEEANAAPALTLVHSSDRRERRKRNARRRKARVTAKQRRTGGQFIAAYGASILPVVSFWTAHYDTDRMPMLWCLVAAGLLFSLPSVMSWARTWSGSVYKAAGFSVLLEVGATFSPTAWISYLCLTTLILANAYAAWGKARGK
jgi:hypothetical protein